MALKALHFLAVIHLSPDNKPLNLNLALSFFSLLKNKQCWPFLQIEGHHLIFLQATVSSNPSHRFIGHYLRQFFYFLRPALSPCSLKTEMLCYFCITWLISA